MKKKRVVVATILGAMFGLYCYSMAPIEGSLALALSAIGGRTMIGLGIGFSRFNLKHWSLHGLVGGLVLSLPALFAPIPHDQLMEVIIPVLVMGTIYGFLIELITTKVFRLPQ